MFLSVFTCFSVDVPLYFVFPDPFVKYDANDQFNNCF